MEIVGSQVFPLLLEAKAQDARSVYAKPAKLPVNFSGFYQPGGLA